MPISKRIFYNKLYIKDNYIFNIQALAYLKIYSSYVNILRGGVFMEKNISKTAFLSLIIFILMTVSAGCGKKDTREQERVIDRFMLSFREGRYEDMYELTNDKAPYFDGIYDPGSEMSRSIFDYFSRNLEYNIEELTYVDGKTVKAKIQLTNADAEKMNADIQNQYLMYCEANQDILDKIDPEDILTNVALYSLQNTKYEKVTNETEINIVKVSGEWKLESGITLYDNLTGGYMTCYYNNNIFGGLREKIQDKVDAALEGNTETTTDYTQ